jgi:cell division protein FtsW
MALKLKSDKLLFLPTLVLVGTSLVMVYSASALMAMERYRQAGLFLTKQVMWVALGVAMLAIVMRVDYRLYRHRVVVATLLSVTGIALIAVLFSQPINNARRWFGFGGIGVQPAELAKLSVIFFTAAFLSRRIEQMDQLLKLLPIGLICGAAAGLVLLQPDFGSAMSIVVIVALMVFSAGLAFRYVFVALATGVPVVLAAILSAPYRWKRVVAFLNPWDDPLGDGFQIIQSLIAVGTGGIFGLGLMGGVQKLFYLPEPHTDFIYAVVAEETGLVGASIMLGCFCLIVARGLHTARWAPDVFGALLAVGLTAMIGIQAFVNMSVVLGLLPTKGIPLPFVSAGGSSLLINLIGMGVLLNISQHVTVRREEACAESGKQRRG